MKTGAKKEALAIFFKKEVKELFRYVKIETDHLIYGILRRKTL